eukprot:968437-Alexandrium_andersonii.AAC.1
MFGCHGPRGSKAGPRSTDLGQAQPKQQPPVNTRTHPFCVFGGVGTHVLTIRPKSGSTRFAPVVDR